MPQAIRPGGYTSLYAQQLLQNIVMQLSQMGGQQAAQNAPIIQTIDNAIGTTVLSVDSQLSTVGVGLGTETQQSQPATFPAMPVLRTVNTDLASRGTVVGNAATPVNLGQPVVNKAILNRPAAVLGTGGAATTRTIAADVNRFSLFA